MVLPGRDPSIDEIISPLTDFLRRNTAPARPAMRPRPMAPPMQRPAPTGLDDPEAMGRALLGPNASPEQIQAMLSAIAMQDGLPLPGGGRAQMPPSRLEASLAARPSNIYTPPQRPAPDWTQGVAERAQPLGLPPQQLAGAGLMGLSIGLPVASPLAGAIAGGIGGTGASVMGGARTPTEAMLGGGVPGALTGAMLGGLGGAPQRAQRPMPEPMPQMSRAPQMARRPMVDAQAQEGLLGPAGMPRGPRMLGDEPITEMFQAPTPGPMPRNDRSVGGQFIRPWRADEIQAGLGGPAGLPQPSLLQRFEGELGATQMGSPVADDLLRGQDPSDWFSKTQPGLSSADRMGGAIPQQDKIMEMLRRRAPNPMMQPAGMPDPDGMRGFFEALAGLRGR